MVPLFVCLFICAYLSFLTLCWCLACWIFFLLKWKCVDVRAVLRIGTVASAWMSWTKPGAWGWRSFWLIILRRGETWTWARTRRSRTMRTRPSASLRCVCVWGYSHVSSAWAWTRSNPEQSDHCAVDCVSAEGLGGSDPCWCESFPGQSEWWKVLRPCRGEDFPWDWCVSSFLSLYKDFCCKS